jgi:hypothetical protein
MAFLSKWKTITAVLLHGAFGQPSMADSDPRVEKIRAAVSTADTFLRPFASATNGDQARLRNLEEIMRRAARVGYELVSQPSFFKFDWHASANELVVFPGLVQLADDNGKALRPPRVFAERSVLKF